MPLWQITVGCPKFHTTTVLHIFFTYKAIQRVCKEYKIVYSLNMPTLVKSVRKRCDCSGMDDLP